MGSNFLSQSAVKNAVFQSNYYFAIFCYLVKRCGVNGACVTCVGKRRRKAERLFDVFRKRLSLCVKIAERNYGYFFAVLRYVVFCRVVGLLCRAVGYRIARHKYDYGTVRLVKRPVQHGHEFCAVGRRKHGEIWYVGKSRNTENPEVRNVGQPVKVGVVKQYRHRVAVYAQVLRQLVVGALHKGGVGNNQRVCPALCQSACHGYRLFLGNADVDKLAAEFCTQVGRKAEAARHIGRYKNKFVVRFGAAHYVLPCNGSVRDRRHRHCRQPRVAIERHGPVPCFFVLLGKCKALALGSVDVYDNGVFDVLDGTENLNERRNVVAVVLVDVVQPECLENVVCACALACAKVGKAFVQSAVCFGNGLLVVVYNDDEVAVYFRAGNVKPLHGFAAGQRPVADYGNYVFAATKQITRLGKTGCK